MTSVDAILERQLPALEELEEFGILKHAEVKAVIEKRRDFEYQVQSRAPQKTSFLRYVSFELNLESLRRLRKSRMRMRKTLQSDHAGLQHVHFIFHRFLRKFGHDVGVWLQYLDFGMRTDAGKKLGAAFARAVARHPRVPGLWLQAASWEFDRNRNVQAARALLQRGLRVNSGSKQLWLEYFRMELLYVQKLKARRLVLGLDDGSGKSGGGDDDDEGNGEEEGVREVLRGAVLVAVFEAAMEAVPNDVPFCGQFLAVLNQVYRDSLPGRKRRVDGYALTSTPPFAAVHAAVLRHVADAFPGKAHAWLMRAQVQVNAANARVQALGPVAEAAGITAARDITTRRQGRSKRRRTGRAPSAKAVVTAVEETEEMTAARVELERQEAAALVIMSEGMATVKSSGMAEQFVDFVNSQLSLPLADSTSQRARVQRLLTITVKTCRRAQAAGGRAWSATLASHLVTALRRLGRGGEATTVAAEVCKAFPGHNHLWTLRAALQRRLALTGAGAGAGAGDGSGEDSDKTASRYGAADATLADGVVAVYEDGTRATTAGSSMTTKSVGALREAIAPILGRRLELWFTAGRKPKSMVKALTRAARTGGAGSLQAPHVAMELLHVALAHGGLPAARKIYGKVLNAGTPLSAFLGVLDMEMAAATAATDATTVGTTAVKAIRAVCERAVAAFGVEEAQVWERYVALERLLGNHAEAAQIRWRATQTLRDAEPFLASQLLAQTAV